MGDVEKALGQLGAYLTAMDPRTVYAFVGIGVFLVVVAIIAGSRLRHGARPEPEPEPVVEAYERTMAPPVPPTPPPSAAVDRQIAEMIETSELTGFGNFCVFMMIVTWAISGIVFVSAKSAPQEAVALLIWIGGNTMFGVGAMLSRQRKYRIYRP